MSDKILEEAIDTFSPACLCALCEGVVEVEHGHQIVVVHNAKYLVHADCLAMLYGEEKEEE